MGPQLVQIAQAHAGAARRCGRVGLDVLAAVVATHEAVGIGVEHAGAFDELALAPDLHAARHGHAGVIAQRDGVADQGGIDFEQGAVQADSVIALHAALGLDLEQDIQIDSGAGQAGSRRASGRTHGPALERAVAVQAAMRAVVIFALDPGPQAAVQVVQAGGIDVAQSGQ